MKIYTKTGDHGETGLYGGGRLQKDDPRIEAIGSVDELNAALGMVRAFGLPGSADELMERIQRDLFNLGAELATTHPEKLPQDARLQDESIRLLEKSIDQWEETLPQLTQFILPGGGPRGAGMHVARSICRRAERHVVRLSHLESIGQNPIVYLNRLGDLLFVMARGVNRLDGQHETFWRVAP